MAVLTEIFLKQPTKGSHPATEYQTYINIYILIDV